MAPVTPSGYDAYPYPPQPAAYPPMAGVPAASTAAQPSGPAWPGWQPSPTPFGYPPMVSHTPSKDQQQTASKGQQVPTGYPADAFAYPDKAEHAYVSPTGFPAQQAGAPPALKKDTLPVAVAPHPKEEGCSCSAGWILFGVGWIFPICWLVGVFLPLCVRNRNNKRAAIGSGVCLIAYIVLIIVLATTVPSSYSYYSY